VVGNLHYQILNDLSWLEDRLLAIASSDGYCSFIKFEENEIGRPATQQGFLFFHLDSEAWPN
jgi:hypothetical protein